MPIQGDLNTMPVPELLTWISQSQKTGTLEVRHGESTRKLGFKDGALIYSASSELKDTLGRVLIRKDVLTEEMWNRAREISQERSVGVAKVLCDLGVVTEEQIVRLMRKKAEKELFDLFELREGEFTFDEGALPNLALLPLHVDVSRMLLRVTQQMD